MGKCRFFRMLIGFITRLIRAMKVMKETKMKKTFTKFSELLKQRFSIGVYTTEDSIRYTFFAALMETTDVLPHNVVLEHPHNTINKAKVDTYITGTGDDDIVVEFKYHRQIPSKESLPKPQLAGELFKDLFRLAQFKTQNADKKLMRLFVYVTDPKMDQYLSDKDNNLVEFYNLQLGTSLKIDNKWCSNKRDSFINACGDICDIMVTMEFLSCPGADHQLRIWSVT